MVRAALAGFACVLLSGCGLLIDQWEQDEADGAVSRLDAAQRSDSGGNGSTDASLDSGCACGGTGDSCTDPVPVVAPGTFEFDTCAYTDDGPVACTTTSGAPDVTFLVTFPTEEQYNIELPVGFEAEFRPLPNCSLSAVCVSGGGYAHSGANQHLVTIERGDSSCGRGSMTIRLYMPDAGP